MRSVTVRAGMRLHLGFYRFSDPPFEYGGLGLAVEEPSLSVTINDKIGRALPEWVAETASSILKGIEVQGNIGVGVEGFLRRHVGLGTTTRFVLSLIKAVYLARGEAVDLPRLAWRFGRGKVSGVGVWTFIYGGMVVDGGRVPDMDGVPPPITHVYLPHTWRAVIALPIIDGYSVSETSEEPVMKSPIEHPKQEVLYSAVTRLISAAHLGVFDEFVTSVEKIQELTGEYFSRWQGGIYCCEQSETLARKMKELNLRGIGQSSWGPTVYGFSLSESEARKAATELVNYMKEIGVEGYVWVTRVARNGHTTRVLSK